MTHVYFMFKQDTTSTLSQEKGLCNICNNQFVNFPVRQFLMCTVSHDVQRYVSPEKHQTVEKLLKIHQQY